MVLVKDALISAPFRCSHSCISLVLEGIFDVGVLYRLPRLVSSLWH